MFYLSLIYGTGEVTQTEGLLGLVILNDAGKLTVESSSSSPIPPICQVVSGPRLRSMMV